MAQKTDESEFTELKCPLCGKPLATDEYHRAIGELQRKQEEKYAEESRVEKESFERKLKLARESFEQKLREVQENREKEISALKGGFEDQLKTLQQTMEGSYKNQLEELKRYYDQLNSDKDKRFKEIEDRLNEETRKQLEAKDKELEELRNSQNSFREQAEEDAKRNAEKELIELHDEIRQRDIQIQRFQSELDDLRKKTSQSQSELQGEVGELNLYAALSRAFEDDHFERQSRGTSEGDIIQHIRTPTGLIDTPIVFDNKEAQQVTKKDIEKALGYRRTHGTNYVLIVSKNLPKREIENGLIGEKEGILIVHPSIVVEVAKQIRSAIIEISKQSESKKDREAKEAKLYDYIKSQEFSATVEKLHRIYEKIGELQDGEEKNHQRLWKERKILIAQIDSTYRDISVGIESIIQNKPIFEEPHLQEFENEGLGQVLSTSAKRSKRAR